MVGNISVLKGDIIMDFMNQTGFANEANGGVAAASDSNGLVFDLSGVEEQTSFELIPKGIYDAVVDELEFGESKAGNPMITVKYQLTDAQYENRTLYDYWVLAGNGSEFGLAKLKKFLVRVCPNVDISNFNPAVFAEQGLAIGNQCRVSVAIQTQKKGDYKGEKRNTIKDVLAPETGSFL